jgi:hypothetical protein
MSRRYLASLAVAAAIVLAVGVLLRDWLLSAQPASPVPPSEASALQQLSQEGQARRLADFLAERVAAVAPNVAYVADANASAVLLGVDSLVTTMPGRPVAVAQSSDSVRVSIVVDAAPEQRDWVVIVGRAPSGSVLSASGMLGGRAPARCGNDDVTRYVLSVPLHDSFAGAGVFDLAGRLIGMVVRCVGELAAVPSSELRGLLTSASAVDARIWEDYGFAPAALDSATRAYFRSDSGLLVTAVRRSSPADQSTLRPGDVVVAIDDRRVTTIDDLATFLRVPNDTHTVTRRRRTGVATIRIAATRANPTPVAFSAGLLPGDRVLQVDGRATTDPAAARRLVEAESKKGPVFVVFERDSVVRGVLVPQ